MNEITAELLGKLLDQHAAALELFARQWCANPEDVIQDAFIKLARQPRLPPQVVPWLYCVVRNSAISARRSETRRRRHENEVAQQSPPWFAEASPLDREAVEGALVALPLEEREVIVAHVWGGLTFQQIAELCGISSSTAHRRYEAGLTSLRERFGVECPKKN